MPRRPHDAIGFVKADAVEHLRGVALAHVMHGVHHRPAPTAAPYDVRLGTQRNRQLRRRQPEGIRGRRVVDRPSGDLKSLPSPNGLQQLAQILACHGALHMRGLEHAPIRSTCHVFSRKSRKNPALPIR
jgi:hypothetical protein